MATFNKFNCFAGDLMHGLHDLQAAGDTVKVYLTNATPNAALDIVKGDLLEITAENGYPSGGTDIQNDVSESLGTASMTGVDVVFSASGGTFGPCRYAVLYNDTDATKPLIGWWDYGSSVTPADTESFTIDFSATIIDIA